jgi:hypothetical protein
MFNTFIEPLEAEFGHHLEPPDRPLLESRKSQEYTDRIEAINFSLAHDDGQSAKNLARPTSSSSASAAAARRRLALPGDAARHQGGELSAHPRGLRARQIPRRWRPSRPSASA